MLDGDIDIRRTMKSAITEHPTRDSFWQDGGVDEILRRQLDGLRVEAEARARSEAVLREEIKRLKRRCPIETIRHEAEIESLRPHPL